MSASNFANSHRLKDIHRSLALKLHSPRCKEWPRLLPKLEACLLSISQKAQSRKAYATETNILTVRFADGTYSQKPRLEGDRVWVKEPPHEGDHVWVEPRDIGSKERIECIVLAVRPAELTNLPGDLKVEYQLQLLPDVGGDIIGGWFAEDQLYDAE